MKENIPDQSNIGKNPISCDGVEIWKNPYMTDKEQFAWGYGEAEAKRVENIILSKIDLEDPDKFEENYQNITLLDNYSDHERVEKLLSPDVKTFYSKYIEDIRDTQGVKGNSNYILSRYLDTADKGLFINTGNSVRTLNFDDKHIAIIYQDSLKLIEKNKVAFYKERLQKLGVPKRDMDNMYEELFWSRSSKKIDEELLIGNTSQRINEGDIYLFEKIFSNNIVRKALEKDLNISFSQTNLVELFNFFSYIKNKTNQEAIKFKNFLHVYKNNGLRTFLSLEHGGKEMGDTILDLGEKLPKESAKKIFEGYAKLIDTADTIKKTLSLSLDDENLSADIQEKLPQEVFEALMLRAKDILIGAHAVANEDITQLNTEDVLLAIEGVNTMLGILADIPNKKEFDFHVINETEHGLKFNITDKKNGYAYELKTFVRPKKEKHAQARINFELNFDTQTPNEPLKKAFFNSMVSHRQNKTTESSTLRIGIDREDYGENDEATVSLDMGRAYREDDELSRTGDILGNFFEAASQSHHTTETFSPEFADEETFSSIANSFLRYLKKFQKTE